MEDTCFDNEGFFVGAPFLDTGAVFLVADADCCCCCCCCFPVAAGCLGASSEDAPSDFGFEAEGLTFLEPSELRPLAALAFSCCSRRSAFVSFGLGGGITRAGMEDSADGEDMAP